MANRPGGRRNHRSQVDTMQHHNASPLVRVRFFGDAATLYNGLPAYATAGSAGIDLRACLPQDGEAIAHILPGERLAVPSGLAVEPVLTAQDPLLAGFVYARSGLGAMQGLTVAQGVGVIDADYRGEIVVVLLNTSQEPRSIRRGDRIAQLVFQPVCRVQLEETATLGETQRGAGGFGHTGSR